MLNSQAGKTDLKMLAERFIRTARTYQPALGGELSAQAQVLLETYLTSRNQQLQAIGNAKELSSAGKATRQALARQLYRNLLSLLLMYADTTGQVKNYFDISFLSKSRREDKTLAGNRNTTPKAA